MRRMPQKQIAAEIPCAITVATAAPAMPHLNPKTNRISSAILVNEATVIALSGVLLSPSARRTDAL